MQYLVLIIVGVAAGWIAGLVFRGKGFGLIGNIVIGIIGAIIGNYLRTEFNINLGLDGLLAEIASAVGGALVLLIALRFILGLK